MFLTLDSRFTTGNDGVYIYSNSMSSHHSIFVATEVHFVHYFNLSKEITGKLDVLQKTISSSVGRKLYPLYLSVMY